MNQLQGCLDRQRAPLTDQINQNMEASNLTGISAAQKVYRLASAVKNFVR